MALVQRLMLRLLPNRWRDSVEGDIEEERHERIEAGQRAGTLWFVTYGGRLIASIAAEEIRDALGRRHGLTPADIAADFRYGSRVLRASPGYFFGVLGSLSIGIAAMAVGFSILDAAYFRPFDGVGNQDQLTRITLDHQDALRADSDFPDRMRILDEQSSSFNGIAAHYPVEFSIVSGTRAATVAGGLVSATFFDVLQMRPAAGRFLDDIRRELPEAVISHRLWADHFARSPGAVGATMTVNGIDVVIVGVAAEGFRGILQVPSVEDVWIPHSASIGHAQRSPFTFTAVGRLTDGLTSRQLKDDTVLQSAVVTPLRRGDPDRGSLIALLALPALILVVACANASSLVLANVIERSGQWRTRVALGASRSRLIRQKLSEDLTLALMSAIVGLLVTGPALRLLEHSVPLDIRLDVRTALATALVAIMAPLMFGLAPACRAALVAARFDAARSSRPRRNPRVFLIAAQSAVALALLCTGTEFVQTVEARRGDDGLEAPERLVIAKLDAGNAGRDRRETDALYASLVDRVRQLPNVTAVAQSCDCDLWGHMTSAGSANVLTHSSARARRVVSVFAGDDFFDALGLPLLDGNPPQGLDRRDNAVYVNTAFAAQMLDGAGIGAHLTIAPVNTHPHDARPVVVAGIVGVPENPHSGAAARKRHDSRPTVYSATPLTHLPARKLYVEFDRQPGASAQRTLQVLLAGPASGVVLRSLVTGDDARRRNQASSLWVAYSVTGIGVVALLLSTAGLFCLVSYSVSRSSREIAIRMALGAPPIAVSILFIRRAFYPVGVGCVLGGVIAASAAGLVQSRLHDASLFNAEAFGIAALALLMTMSLATVIPAMRAARTEPCQMLRSE